MTAPGVILVDGMPGSGKSVTAHRLCDRLRRLGRDARWVYEHETPHPIIDVQRIYAMIQGLAPIDPALYDEAVERWRGLAEACVREDRVVVAECMMIQTPLHPLFQATGCEAEIRDYMDRVVEALAPARPRLVYLRPREIGAALMRTFAGREPWFQGVMIEWISASPIGRARGLAGIEGAIEYFRLFHEMTDELVARIDPPALTLAPDEGGWPERESAIDRWLGLSPAPSIVPLEEDLRDLPGRYRDAASEDAWTIARLGDDLVMTGQPSGRLLPVGPGRFEVEGMALTISFERPALAGAAGEALRRVAAGPPLAKIDPPLAKADSSIEQMEGPRPRGPDLDNGGRDGSLAIDMAPKEIVARLSGPLPNLSPIWNRIDGSEG